MTQSDKDKLKEILKNFYKQQYEHFSQEILDKACSEIYDGWVRIEDVELDEDKIYQILNDKFPILNNKMYDELKKLAHAIASSREVIKRKES